MESEDYLWKLRGKWYGFRAWLLLVPLWRIKTAAYYLWLSWLAVRGKIINVSSHESTARGGYKYLSLVISKMPMSSTHTYEDV